MRFESASKDRDRWCSFNVIRQAVPYCWCGTTKSAWSNFRMGWIRFELPVVGWRSQRTSKNLARDAGSTVCWFTGLQEFVRQSGENLIVYAPLDRKPMKLLQSLGDTDASPLTCDNTSEHALQTLRPRNILNWDPSRGSSCRNRGDSRRENR